MDIGATVGNIALYTAFFACLSYIALSVELGQRPKIDKSKHPKRSGSFLSFFKKKPKSEKSGKFEVEDVTEEKDKSPKPNKTANDAQLLDRTLDTTHAALTDGVARSELNENVTGSDLPTLRAKFIDGFLGPRIKYDVALTTLYESQNKKVLKPDEGLDVATQAFMEATQSIVFTED